MGLLSRGLTGFIILQHQAFKLMVCNNLSFVTLACDLGLVWVWFLCGYCLFPPAPFVTVWHNSVETVWHNLGETRNNRNPYWKTAAQTGLCGPLVQGFKRDCEPCGSCGETQFCSLLPLGKGNEIVNGCKHLLWLGNCKLSSVAKSSLVSRGRGVCVTSHSSQIQPVLLFLCHGRTELRPTEETVQNKSGQVEARVEQVCLNMLAQYNEMTFPQGAQRNRIII